MFFQAHIYPQVVESVRRWGSVDRAWREDGWGTMYPRSIFRKCCQNDNISGKAVLS